MKTSFSDQIRRCLSECGMSRYAISKATGIDQATLSRFKSGAGGLSIEALDKLAEVIGMVATLGERRVLVRLEKRVEKAKPISVLVRHVEDSGKAKASSKPRGRAKRNK